MNGRLAPFMNGKGEHAGRYKQHLIQLGFLRDLGCLSLQLYCYSGSDQASYIRERKREREDPRKGGLVENGAVQAVRMIA